MVKELIVRPATLKDAEQIADIERESFSKPWPESTVKCEIEGNAKTEMFVVTAENIIIGYIDTQIILDEADIRRVAVMPDFRGMSVGSVLMHTMLHFTEEAGVKYHTLEVNANNESAIALYKKFGFVQNGLRKDYYDGEDAILMARIGDPDDHREEKTS